ncbi:hypothetical protein [Klebsiella variicola]|uniref:hypothetical protein n=1 Tax=Klebsiella variicola TaxID=244366 RepID=UPI003A4DD4DC
MVSANEIRQADTPLGRAKKMADALERGHDEDDLALMPQAVSAGGQGYQEQVERILTAAGIKVEAE